MSCPDNEATKLESKKDFPLKEDYLNKKIKLLIDQFV